MYSLSFLELHPWLDDCAFVKHGHRSVFSCEEGKLSDFCTRGGWKGSAIALSLNAAQHVEAKHDSASELYRRLKIDISYQAPHIDYTSLYSLPIVSSELIIMLLELYQPPPSKLDTYYILGEIA